MLRSNTTAGNDEYDIANLVYAGKGGLFDAIRRSIDPVKISHPLWDEKTIEDVIARYASAMGAKALPYSLFTE